VWGWVSPLEYLAARIASCALPCPLLRSTSRACRVGREEAAHGHHAQALGAEDLEEIVADYSDDAVFITPAGVQRGKDDIDTFVFRDGLIRVQTVRYTLQPAG